MHVILETQWRDIIEARLLERGWSRSELARRMGATPQFVTNYLNGRSTPGPDVMERFLKGLGLSPRLIVEEISEPVA